VPNPTIIAMHKRTADYLFLTTSARLVVPLVFIRSRDILVEIRTVFERWVAEEVQRNITTAHGAARRLSLMRGLDGRALNAKIAESMMTW